MILRDEGFYWVVLAASIIGLLVGMCAALAQHNHDLHHVHYRNWINKADKGCCNDQDCGELREENERATSAGGIEVHVEGQWCPILSHHYLKRGNAPDWSTSHVCVLKRQPYFPASPCDRLLCYQPKPGF